MKLIAADVILLIIGLVILAGATGGLVATGGFETVTQQSSPTGLFNVTFETSGVASEQKSVGSYASGQQTFDVKATNVTSVKFTIACIDPAPSQAPRYAVTASVEGPNGTKAGPTTKNCGEAFEFLVELADAPSAGAVQGNNEEEARANLAPNPNATKAVGTWTVKYSGQRQTLPLQPNVGVPTGNIKIDVTGWKATLTAVAK